MFKKVFLCFIFILQVIIFTGCSNNSPENAINNIINYYNNGDILAFWEMVAPEERYAVFSNMAENINNYDLFSMMAYALNKDNITVDNLSSEEYLYGSFKVIFGDKDMELVNLEMIDDAAYSASVKLGEKYAVIHLKLIDGKWYMKIKE